MCCRPPPASQSTIRSRSFQQACATGRRSSSPNLFLRARQLRPAWWDLARQKAKLFPGNDRIAFFAAEAAIDDATRDPRFHTMRLIDKERRQLLLNAAEVFEAQWQKVLASEAKDSAPREVLLSHAMLARQIRGDFDSALDKADELIARTSDADLLLNATQVAMFSRRHDLAERALAKVEDFAEIALLPRAAACRAPAMGGGRGLLRIGRDPGYGKGSGRDDRRPGALVQGRHHTRRGGIRSGTEGGVI